MSNFWQKVKKPIKVLAPMAGYTDSAFRSICRENGADVVITDLISADAIFHKAKNWYQDEKGEWQNKKGKDETLEMLKFYDDERPIAIQLFGKFPEKFAFAAEWITKNLKPDGIDINMGCPARKVVGSDHGAALLKNCALATEIIEAIKSNTDLPVSVKTRLGWENDEEILEFAPELVKAGIDALIIHGRTYKDGFKGIARWENIYKVKELFGDRITVIGNGDIVSFENLRLKIENCPTQLDGYAIGRATFGRPWIFGKESISKEELQKLVLKHAKLALERKGEFGLVEFRKHLLAYLKGNSHATELRRLAVDVSKLDDIRIIVAQM